jgi:Chaperone of endosialidase
VSVHRSTIDGTTGAPNGSWEIGTGHLSGASTLVRDTVRQSSNADALVAFAAGTKNVFCTLPASVVIALQAKLDDAPSDGKTYGRKDAVWAEATVGTTKAYVDAADALRVLKAGDVMTGTLTVPAIVMDAAAGNSLQILGQRAGVGRWVLALGDANAEAGSNAGSNFAVARFADGGGYLDNPFNIKRDTGNVGIGTATPGSKLDVAGDINITGVAYKPGGGSWTAPSDARIKQVLGDYKQGLAEVCKLSPVRYLFKGNYYKQPPAGSEKTPHQNFAEAKTEFVGLIAQQAEIPMPEMVTTEAGYIDGKPVADLRVLDTTALIFALVNACKELAARIEALEQAA